MIIWPPNIRLRPNIKSIIRPWSNDIDCCLRIPVLKRTSNRSPMTSHKNTGTIKTGVPTHEVPIEWRIRDFSSVITENAHPNTCYDSPIFLVNGVSWFLRLYPRAKPNFEFLKVYIKTKMIREYAVEYNFSLKKSDGTVELRSSGILEGNRTCSNAQDINRSEILQRTSELTPQDVLTLICRLKFESICFTETVESDKTKTSRLMRLDKFSKNFKDTGKKLLHQPLFHANIGQNTNNPFLGLDKLSKNLKDLYGDKETCDVILKVMDKEYKAHKFVLIARSSVFAATFKHDTLEKQTGVITISDCDPDSFQEFLDYLYSGELEELSFSSAKSLYYTSDKYDVKELREFCMEYLMQCLTVENVCEVAVLSDKYEESELYKVAQQFFIENSFQILLTSEWEHLLKNDYRLGNKLLTEMVPT